MHSVHREIGGRWPIERRLDRDDVARPYAQAVEQLRPHRRGKRRREESARDSLVRSTELSEQQVVWAEVLSPREHAVGLVNDETREEAARVQPAEAVMKVHGLLQPLGGHVQQSGGRRDARKLREDCRGLL